MINKLSFYIAAAAIFAAACAVTTFAQSEVSARFTSFFMGGAQTDFDPAFNALRSNPEFALQAGDWAQAALAGVQRLNFIPLERGITGKTGISAKVDPGAIFIRGLVTRGDIKKVQHFSIDEFVFSVNATLEFFDLASGEVYYTRTLTGQAYLEKPKNSPPSAMEKRDYFSQCLKGTVEALVKRVGEDYQPGVIEGHIIAVEDSVVVLDLGRSGGLYQGMTFYCYDDSGNPAGLLKTESPEENICPARMVFYQGNPPKRGTAVKSFGVNKLLGQKGQTRYMVAQFTLSSPAAVHPDFIIDSQSMGQWLHDGLSSKTELFMLAPLLVKLDEKGAVQAQEALWEAQLSFSIFGGLSQSAAMGKRAFPDVLIKGVVTHADIQEFTTPGAVNKILEVGVSLEFYDRKTRDYLYSCQHSGRRVEKVVKDKGKTYRDVDLTAAFRDLCKDVIREAAEKVGKEYHPYPLDGDVISVMSDSEFVAMLMLQNASQGDMLSLYRETGRYQGLSGEDLGALYRNYGIAKVLPPVVALGEMCRIVVSDGKTTVQKGDILRMQGKPQHMPRGKLCQVTGFRAEGKVSGEYSYSLPRLTEWLHDALLATRAYRLLPPNFREADMGTAEVGLALGQFETAGQGEIIYQGFRLPEALVSGRLGLADYKVESGEFKNKVLLRVGIEITFTTAAGDTLFSKKLAGKREIEQTKRSSGKVEIGTEDLSPEFDGLAQNTIEELAGKAKEEFRP